MNKIALIFGIVSIFLINCDNASEPESPIVNSWQGMYFYQYSGPEGEPFVDQGDICILFVNNRIYYSLNDCDGEEWQVSGNYTFEGTTLTITDVSNKNRLTLILDGEYVVELDEGSIEITQMQGIVYQSLTEISATSY